MKRLELFLMVLQVPLDFVLLLCAATTAYFLRFHPAVVATRPVMFSLSLVDFLSIAVFVSVVWVVLFAINGLYKPSARRFAQDVIGVFTATASGLAIVALYLLFTQQQFDSRFLLAASWVFAVVYIIVGRLVLRGVKSLCYRSGIGLRRVVVIGGGSTKDIILHELMTQRRLGYVVVGTFGAFTTSVGQELLPLSLDGIIYANPRSNESEALAALAFANEHHIAFSYSADLFATFTANMSVHPLAGIPIVEVRRARIEGWGRVVKRLFDIVGSIVGIIITSPLMIVSALVILYETGRPILYKNERVGMEGKHFFTLKFRSMFQNQSTGAGFGGAEAEAKERELIQEKSIKQGPVYKIANDPRVTPFGAFIRRFSIDELPQFFNVLFGTMSLVGPRPHQPREVAQYQSHHRRVLSIKPGISGLAQISGRSDLSFEDEVRLDVLYMERWSVWLDIIICLKTPFVLFKRRKAL
jgi:exopolysaccharide biosynthesis polyprenyl glycosylphosphotransferase